MFGKKKVENKSQFKTEAELQRYIGLKINSTLTSLMNRGVDVQGSRYEMSTASINKLHERIVHLEKFLGIEFGTETTTGYKKVKTVKKKK